MALSPYLRTTGAMLAVILLASCGSGGGGAGSAGSGALTLRITDGPVDTAEHVYIQFRGLELQPAGGGRITLYYCQDPADATKTVVSATPCTTPAAPKQLDLLTLTGGQADFLLDSYMLPAGHYSWIRLMVDTGGYHDSYIVVAGGADYPLTIPSANQTGLKLNRGFDVPDGGSADFAIDFDLRKSVHVTGNGKYMMRPTLRLVDHTQVGTIAGTVNPALVPGGCTPAVYVYAGTGVVPDDIDDNAPDPVTTATVKLDSGSGEYRYAAAFLEPGDYTVAYTCDAAHDDQTVDNTPTVNPPTDIVTFTGAASVAVTANTTTVHNF